MVRHRISLIVILAIIILAAIGLYLFLNLVNPLVAGPLGILVAFALIYVFCLATLLLIVRFVEIVDRLLHPVMTEVREDKLRRMHRRSNYIVAALSLVPIFLLSLNSIGQLGFRDVALVVAIEGLIIFYIIRRV